MFSEFAEICNLQLLKTQVILLVNFTRKHDIYGRQNFRQTQALQKTVSFTSKITRSLATDHANFSAVAQGSEQERPMTAIKSYNSREKTRRSLINSLTKKICDKKSQESRFVHVCVVKLST